MTTSASSQAHVFPFDRGEPVSWPNQVVAGGCPMYGCRIEQAPIHAVEAISCLTSSRLQYTQSVIPYHPIHAASVLINEHNGDGIGGWAVAWVPARRRVVRRHHWPGALRFIHPSRPATCSDIKVSRLYPSRLCMLRLRQLAPGICSASQWAPALSGYTEQPSDATLCLRVRL
jgi:hypothetical protein